MEANIERWNNAQAFAWYQAQPWLVGCNFIPSTAIIQLEMWQKDGTPYNPAEIQLIWELGGREKAAPRSIGDEREALTRTDGQKLL